MPRKQPTAKRIDWLRLCVEAFLIVFSVLLALGLNEVRQNAANKRLVDRVRETISDELSRNLDIIRGRLPYHESMQTSTSSFLNENLTQADNRLTLRRRASPEELGFDRSMGLATSGQLLDTGWQLAVNSGALDHMSFEEVVVLSDTYARQQVVEDQQRILLAQLDQLFRAYFEDGSFGGATLSFSSALTDMVLREQELIKAYEVALASPVR